MGLILIFNSPLSATFCTLEICLCKGARRAWSTPEDNLLLLPANGSSGFVLAARGGFITLRLLSLLTAIGPQMGGDLWN